MKHKQILHIIPLLAVVIGLLAGASPVFGQSKVSDFSQPIQIAPVNTHLSVKEVEKLLADNSDLVILDVRKKSAYDRGHLANAIHIDYFNPNFESELDKLDKDKSYVVYCKSGVRSDETVRRMNNLGIDQISIMGGGFRAWKAAGKEIVREDS